MIPSYSATASDLSVYYDISSASVQPSFQLICALRLANIALPDEADEDALERALIPWRNVAWCFSDAISEENESLMKKDVMQIGLILQKRAFERLQELNSNKSAMNVKNMRQWACHDIQKLWEEERDVAHGLLHIELLPHFLGV